MTKELLVMECININAWYDQARQSKKLNGLTVKTLWALRKNMKKIAEVVDSFNEFKTSLENELTESYFNDEKSEETTTTNEQGQEIPVRKIKDEYLTEYQKEIDEINKKLNDLALTKEKIEFSSINIESEIEKIGEECSLDMDDLDILSVFEQNEKEA